jgi:beta-phosphoglucomutase-like phosphatase (HAD superfamily)
MRNLRTPRKQGAVILDMDGLMLDTEPLYQRAWERAAADLGYTLSAEFYYRALAGRRLDEYGQELLDTYGPTFPFERFMELALIGWRELAEAEGAPPKQGLHELLRWLRTEGLSVAVATGNDRWRTELLLTRAGLRDSMSHVVTREDASAGKPRAGHFSRGRPPLGVSTIPVRSG